MNIILTFDFILHLYSLRYAFPICSSMDLYLSFSIYFCWELSYEKFNMTIYFSFFEIWDISNQSSQPSSHACPTPGIHHLITCHQWLLDLSPRPATIDPLNTLNHSEDPKEFFFHSLPLIISQVIPLCLEPHTSLTLINF